MSRPDPRRRGAWARRGGWAVLTSLVFALSIARPVDQAAIDDAGYLAASLKGLEAALGPAPDISGSGPLEAGLARREIAPPLAWNVPLAANRGVGFTRAAGRRSESVWARALALRQGDRRAVLVSADILVIHPELAERVRERMSRVAPIAAGELLLVAAHTHSGPGGYWDTPLAGLSVGPYDERVLDHLVEQLAATALEAAGRTVPARALAGERALPHPVKNRAYPRGPENPTLGLLRIEALDGSFVVDVANYGAHPANLLRGNDLYSGDYPAMMAEMVDGPGRMLLFTPGTIGDLKPAFDGVPDPAMRARSMAEHLVERGVRSMTLGALDPPVLESFELMVAMPPLQPRLFRSDLLGSWVLRRWLARRLFPRALDSAAIQVVRLGSLVLIGAPADLSTSLAAPLIERARRRGLTVYFVSMSDGWVGYLMRASEYRDVDYKPVAQLHGPQAGELFRRVYERLIDRLADRTSPVVGTASTPRRRSVPGAPS